MINYESILSSYDDKLTLMQWLKKVEAALAASVLTAVDVTQNGDVVTLSFDFEDGTKLEAPSFRVNQQITGAQIVNGELVFTLSNGQTINAGNLLDGNPLIIPAVNVNFNGNATIEGFLTAEAGVSTPSLTCDGSQINAQKPVVELMNGYSIRKIAAEKYTLDFKYGGIVKNGNKLTIAFSIDITPLEASVYGAKIAEVVIPSSVLNKIIPSTIAAGTYASLQQVQAFDTEYNTPKSINAYYSKIGTRLDLYITHAESLVADKKYNMRFETTYLLSENLAA